MRRLPPHEPTQHALDATLQAKPAQWDDADGQAHTTATTSHYHAGHAASPGAQAVARRNDDPRLLPSEHAPHSAHRAESAAVDPVAATHHSVTHANALPWHTSEPPVEVVTERRLRGLPPQRTADWGPSSAALAVTGAAVGILDAAAHGSVDGVADQASEWGDVPLLSGAARSGEDFVPRPPPSRPPHPGPPPAVPPPSPPPPALPGEGEWLDQVRS